MAKTIRHAGQLGICGSGADENETEIKASDEKGNSGPNNSYGSNILGIVLSNAMK